MTIKSRKPLFSIKYIFSERGDFLRIIAIALFFSVLIFFFVIYTDVIQFDGVVLYGCDVFSLYCGLSLTSFLNSISISSFEFLSCTWSIVIQGFQNPSGLDMSLSSDSQVIYRLDGRLNPDSEEVIWCLCQAL